MEHAIKQEIITALKEYMKEHKMNQSEVAKRTKVRKEYLSIMLREGSEFMYDAGGKQGFIDTKYFNALADLCGYSLEKEYWQTQPTEQTIAIMANLQDAKENHLALTLIGETGCGKTHTAQLFARRNPMDTFIVTAGSSDTLNDLIDKIMESLNLYATGQSKSSKLRWISRKMSTLKDYGHKPMLIIDESEYLKVAALCAMKELYDNLHNFCSLVFIGTSQLIENIEKLKRRNKSGIPQFHRRIKFGLRVLPAIDKGFQLFVRDVEDRALKRFLLHNCNNYGELHDVLVPATREADKRDEPLTLNLVRKVLNINEDNLVW